MKLKVKIVLFIFLCLFDGNVSAGAESAGVFEYVKSKLVSDGYDRDAVNDFYNNPAVVFSPKCIMPFFPAKRMTGKPGTTSVYSQFLTRDSIDRAVRYLQAYRSTLNAAEKKYGVDPEVVVGIILVETRLGENTGNWPVINALSSLVALGNPETREMFWNLMPAERKQSKPYYLSRAVSRADWAYRELKSFLDLVIMAGIRPEKISGSYAGALGIPQFMPSNILSLGEDGNNDGFIDLFNHSDAIFSVAKYFSENGWKPGISAEKAHNVVLRYNKSGAYARTVLEIAGRLRGV